MSSQDEASDDLHEALVRAADHSAPCARVLRFHEDRQVATRPQDFYTALKRVDPLVVRLDCDRPAESLLPLDCRYRDAAVEFTHEHRTAGVVGRDEFVDDVRDADSVTLVHHAESQFADGDENVDVDADDQVRADGGSTPPVVDAVFEALDQHADDATGAPAGRVLTTVLDETDHSFGVVCSTLRELYHTGQIYQPNATNIKPTNPDNDDDGGESGELRTDGGQTADREHVYAVTLPSGTRRWTPDYAVAFEHATGRSLDAIDPSEYEEQAEDRISILHKRGREYVLNLAPENPYTECLNRQYDCGHVAYGPPRELPSACPECKPTATDGGVATSGTEQPEVVCLCGSTRFKDQYRAENRRLTMAGKIVLSVGLFGHADGHEFSDEEKELLDALHKRKIDLADRIHVINVDGYIGDSTQSEVEYARRTDTEITYLEQPVETDGGTTSADEDSGQNPEYYVLDDRHADPATVVAGPLTLDEAQRTASIRTPSGDVMHLAPLVYSIQSHDYNVEWREDVEPPESLTVFDDEEVSS